MLPPNANVQPVAIFAHAPYLRAPIDSYSKFKQALPQAVLDLGLRKSQNTIVVWTSESRQVQLGHLPLVQEDSIGAGSESLR
jgi:hypothetical protein